MSHRNRRSIAARIAVAATAFMIAFSGATVAQATTGDHYVDCGSTAPSLGTSSSPWNTLADANAHGFGPGDRLNIKSGTRCVGTLAPTGSGTQAAPIVVQPYGTGARPIIDGAGAETAVRLRDVSHWTIRGIEAVNASTTRTLRTGILYHSTTAGAKAGVVIDDVYVHDVAGWGDKTVDGQKYVYSAGIVVKVDTGAGAYAGIRITNSTVKDTGGGGIKVTGDTTLKHTNVYVGGNTIERAGGDGIVIHNSQAPLVERNTALDLGLGAYPLVGGNFAGMWPYNSSDPVFQFNVVGGSRPSVFDSTAWDCDHNVTGTCTYQYNYSYGNAGGFYLNCLVNCAVQNTATNVVLRYNIAQDDCRFVLASGGTGVHYVYNNTFYCPTKPVVDTIDRNIVWQNNLFLSPSGSFATGTGVTFANNAISGGVPVPATATGTITADPKLTAPGSGREKIDSTSGYRLAAGSPLIGAGQVIAANGGRDFFGNPVSTTAAPNIGAYNGPGIAVTPTAVESLFNQTAVTSNAQRNTGAVYTSGRSFSAESLEASGHVRGAPLSVAGFDFTWHGGAYGLPDNVKAAGQRVALPATARYIGVLGFSAGGTTSGTATVHLKDGSTRTVTLQLSDWFDSAARFGNNTAAVSAPSHNIWSEPYNSGTFGRVGSTETVGVKAWVATIDLGSTLQIDSITLPAGSPTVSAGLHVFGVDTR